MDIDYYISIINLKKFKGKNSVSVLMTLMLGH